MKGNVEAVNLVLNTFTFNMLVSLPSQWLLLKNPGAFHKAEIKHQPSLSIMKNYFKNKEDSNV
jgi:hypothetical protein